MGDVLGFARRAHNYGSSRAHFAGRRQSFRRGRRPLVQFLHQAYGWNRDVAGEALVRLPSSAAGTFIRGRHSGRLGRQRIAVVPGRRIFSAARARGGGTWGRKNDGGGGRFSGTETNPP